MDGQQLQLWLGIGLGVLGTVALGIVTNLLTPLVQKAGRAALRTGSNISLTSAAERVALLEAVEHQPTLILGDIVTGLKGMLMSLFGLLLTGSPLLAGALKFGSGPWWFCLITFALSGAMMLMMSQWLNVAVQTVNPRREAEQLKAKHGHKEDFLRALTKARADYDVLGTGTAAVSGS